VRYPLLQQAGRRLTGLIAAAVDKQAGAVHIYTNFAEEGTKIGEKVLDRPQAFINAKVGNNRGDKLVPLYFDEQGKPLLDEDGKPAPLPMGTKHIIARKEVWDFTEADNVVSQTALALVEHFKRDDVNAHAEGAEQNHADAGWDSGEEDLDMEEAARVAMR